MPFQPTKTITEEQALQKLAALCSHSEHSSGEMREKMRRWQLPDDAQERVLERLIAERFIDDARFARLFVRDRLRFASWGERKISMALHQKGIDEATAREALDEVPEDEWTAVLRKVIAAKRRVTKAASDYDLRAKLMRHALSRGFSMQQIERCLDD
jgi:regulatory protein